jgi:hypothetical protein
MGFGGCGCRSSVHADDDSAPLLLLLLLLLLQVWCRAVHQAQCRESRFEALGCV